MKVLLFLNGQPPLKMPDTGLYDLIMCTDGAYNYVKAFLKPDVISGDFDSIKSFPSTIEVIQTPDQNYTDFEKALVIILQKGGTSVDVYGASGKEQDHFLGNLYVALKFENDLSLTFYDDFHYYFVTSKNITFTTSIGKMVSLYPYPVAENVTTKGLKYPLTKETLRLNDRIGTRNEAIRTNVRIHFTQGTLIIFIEKE